MIWSYTMHLLFISISDQLAPRRAQAQANLVIGIGGVGNGSQQGNA